MSSNVRSIIAEALNGANRPAPVMLGNVTLEGHEAPSRIMIGGAQAYTMHKLPGGGRIIDAMGPDESAIAWRGLFIGPTAASRVRLLDAMRVQGLPVGLSFGDYQFKVLIVRFEYSYQDRGAVISYAVRTEIVPDGTVGGANMKSTLQSVLADCSLVQQILTTTTETAASYGGIVAPVGVLSSGVIDEVSDNVGSSIASLRAQTGNANSLSAGNAAFVVDSAMKIRGAIQDLSVGQLGARAPALVLASGAELASVTVSAGALAGAVRAGAYLNRASASIATETASTISPIIYA